MATTDGVMATTAPAGARERGRRRENQGEPPGGGEEGNSSRWGAGQGEGRDGRGWQGESRQGRGAGGGRDGDGTRRSPAGTGRDALGGTRGSRQLLVQAGDLRCPEASLSAPSQPPPQPERGWGLPQAAPPPAPQPAPAPPQPLSPLGPAHHHHHHLTAPTWAAPAAARWQEGPRPQPPPLPPSLEELRRQRLRREAEEGARARALLEKMRGGPPDNEPPLDDRARPYNSQFNPHLARGGRGMGGAQPPRVPTPSPKRPFPYKTIYS
uniref:Uncharacterized protein n=1 Tax=Calidris pygmaea TaxID=425635 RepID=A0A8C3JI50_9CHAR